VAGRGSGLFDGEWVKGGFSPVEGGSATGPEKSSGNFFFLKYFFVRFFWEKISGKIRKKCSGFFCGRSLKKPRVQKKFRFFFF
jgi:hypothetical protein